MPNILMKVFSRGGSSSSTLDSAANYPEVTEASEIFGTNSGRSSFTCSKKTVVLVGVVACVVVIAVIMTTTGLTSKKQDDNKPLSTRATRKSTSEIRATAVLGALKSNDTSSDGKRLTIPTLNDFLNGVYSAKSFRGKWISASKFVQRSDEGSLVSHDVVTGQVETLVPSEVLANMSISSHVVSPDGKKVLLLTDVHRIYRYSKLAKYFVYDVDTKRIDFLTPNPTKHLSLMLAEWSPTSNAIAYVFNSDIYYQTLPISRNNLPIKLTVDGVPGMVFNGLADWVYEEEVLSTAQAMWFNEDGSALGYAQFNDTEVPLMEFPIYGPITDDNLYPEIYQLHYPKAGTTNPTITLYTVNLNAARQQNNEPVVSKIRVPRELHQTEHYFALAQWQPNAAGGKFMVVWMNRNQNVSLYSLCSGNYGEDWECDIVHSDEVSGGWTDPYTIPVFSNDGTSFIQILPANEGDGGRFNHIHILELNTLQLLQVSTGTLTVTKVVHWRETSGAIYFIAAPLAHPSQRHLYKTMDPRVKARIVSPKTRHVAKEKAAVECLSCTWTNLQGQPCLYASVDASKDGSHFVFECQGPLSPSEFYLYETDSLRKIGTLVTNDEVYQQLQGLDLPMTMDLEVDAGRGKQRSFTAKVRLLMPPSYGRRKSGQVQKYPMLVYTYGGPNSQIVRDAYRGVDWATVLSSGHEIIYAMIDGRGSGLRGNELLFTLHHGLGTVEVEDQIGVTRHLIQTYDFIDADKVGIWGWSYGGFVAGAALSRGDVFKCGVSVAPVTNWLYYDSIYTERYMGLPDDYPDAYEAAELTSDPEGFKNKLYYLIHGNADDNVHYQQSMMLSKALELHDVLFRQQSYPDENHSLGGVQRHLYHSMLNFWTKDCFGIN